MPGEGDHVDHDTEREPGDQRPAGVVIDLQALETQAQDLFLHRFVDYVRKARGEYGRYLILRAGDAAAIRAAGDGSAEHLDQIIVDPGASESGTSG